LLEGQVTLDARTLESKLETLIKRQIPCILQVSWTPPDAKDLEKVRQRITANAPQQSHVIPEAGGGGTPTGSGDFREGISGRWLIERNLSFKENTGDEGLYPGASLQAKDMLNTLLEIYAGYVFEITPRAIILHEGKNIIPVPVSFEEVGDGEYRIRSNKPERYDFRSCKVRGGVLHLVLSTYNREFILVCKPQ
jgi:hypothetical protein